MANNLYQKISEITAALGSVQKDSKAPKEMGGYEFISHGMVLAHLRHELTKRNVVIHPSGEELLHHEAFEKKTIKDYNGEKTERITFNFHSVIKYKFTVVDGDNPSDFFEDYWIGEGMDSSDKGVQKAGTSAEKYYLMKLFKIGDKDDPDAIDPTGDSTTSDSATITKPEKRPGVLSFKAAGMENPTKLGADTTKLEQLVETAGLNNGKETSKEDHKKQLDAIVWLGEQTPPDAEGKPAGWFRGKVVALDGLYDNKKKTNKLTPEELEAGSGVNNLFNIIAAEHKERCGDNCEHVQVTMLALKSNGTISDPANKT